MAFNRRTINKELDIANLNKHNDNYADIESTLDAHDIAIATSASHIADGSIHTTAAEKTKLAGISAGAGGDNSATDTVIGNRTATDSVAPSLTGTITALFSSLFTLIRGITGKSNALTAPAITLEATRTHVDDTTVHITAAERTTWNGKVDKVTGKQLSTEDYSTAEKTKLSGIATGAQANQNAFSMVNDITASNTGDTVTIEAGTGITVTSNPTTKKLTVTATGTATPGAHASSHLTGGSDPIPVATTNAPGLMAAADKTDIATIKTSLGRVDLTQTLGPGLSVVTADANGSELDLTVNGRTLVNLLGTAGGCESLAGWTLQGAAPVLSTTQKRSGSSSFKMVAGTSSGSYVMRPLNFTLDKAKQYLLGCWMYIEAYSGGFPAIALYDTVTSRYANNPIVSANGSWQFVYVKIPQSNTLVGDTTSILLGYGSGGASTVYYDEVRLYEVTASEYASIGTTITGEAIDAYFPYVDGKQHVQGVAITKQGRNLLPGVISGSQSSRIQVRGPYDVVLTTAFTYDASFIDIPVVPGQTYVFSIDPIGNGGYADGNWINDAGDQSGQSLNATAGGTVVSSPVPENIYKMRIYFANTVAGTFTFKNWKLELGSIATPFTSAEPQTVILPVTLGEVGGVRDSVYSAGTEWVYEERIKKMVLSGALPWEYVSNAPGNAKVLYITELLPQMIRDYAFIAMKFGRTLITPVNEMGAANQAYFTAASNRREFHVSVSNVDSGWGADYIPSVSEVKAYFYGYCMNNGTFGTPYNGSGTKTWVVIGATSNTGAVTIVPTAQAPITVFWQPYTLDYALGSAAAPVVIPNAEGSITLHPGNNQVNVETGLILRERAYPQVSQTPGYYDLNLLGYTSSYLKHKVDRILEIYKGVDKDTHIWQVVDYLAYGNGRAYIAAANYDSEAEYYVTYSMLDKYALTASVTETAATWRTGLSGVVSDLVQSTAELRQENDRQDFADDYIEAKADNLRVDMTEVQTQLNGVINPWGDNTASQRSTVWAYRAGSNQTIASSTFTKVLFDADPADNLSEYNTATGIYTAAKPGWRIVRSRLLMQSVAVGSACYLRAIHSSGAVRDIGFARSTLAADLPVEGNILIYLASGETVYVDVYCNSATSVVAGDPYSRLEIICVSGG
ncbi:hypothetical protein NYE33_20525 [Paenibacillus sp. FSL R10-2199]|uniref:hypothetical protein n=1 Tax=Paenibacillus sp. FSL R10-2199 TaxID=2975348 RepID=UPI0030F5F948